MNGRPYVALLYWLLPSGLLCACVWRLRPRFPGLFEGCCLLILMASIEMVTGCFGDAQDPERHLFIYNAMVDIIFVGAFAALLQSPGLAARRENG